MLMGVFERLIGHVRGQAVAYLALFVALGGTGYAAVGLARHSIRPVMFDPQRIAGYVAAWAQIAPGGRVISASPFKPKVVQEGCAGTAPGYCVFAVIWGGLHPHGFCTALATAQPISGINAAGEPAPPYGYEEADSGQHEAHGQPQGLAISVSSYGPQGQFQQNQVAVAAICHPPAR
jgi:hypothetical protein